jgi:hypothetical protein
LTAILLLSVLLDVLGLSSLYRCCGSNISFESRMERLTSSGGKQR